MEHLENWVLQLDPTDEHDPTNYFSSKPAYSSEIYAKVDGGDLAEVAYIPLVLTESDHETIRKLEAGEREALDKFFHRQEQPKKHWWQRLGQKTISPIIDEVKWHAIHKQYDDVELVYRPRHSKELHDAHLHLVLAVPYMYKVLATWQETGQLDATEATRALNIAVGKETPHIERIPKWRQRNPLE